MIILVAAAGKNNALGKNNDLPWHLPDDFKHFKKLTLGQHIIMGRKTFDSFPSPLPNRTHIVISRHYKAPTSNVIFVTSIEEAYQKVPANQDAYVIGGGQIYAAAIADAHRIELTRIHGIFEADVYFPEINLNTWQLIRETFHQADAQHKYAFSFQTWERKS